MPRISITYSGRARSARGDTIFIQGSSSQDGNLSGNEEIAWFTAFLDHIEEREELINGWVGVIVADYLGTMDLAKRYGRFGLYRLRRIGETE